MALVPAEVGQRILPVELRLECLGRLGKAVVCACVCVCVSACVLLAVSLPNEPQVLFEGICVRLWSALHWAVATCAREYIRYDTIRYDTIRMRKRSSLIVGSADHTRNSALLTTTASPLMATLLSSVATETKTCGAYERRWRTISYDYYYSISHHTHPISGRTWPFRRGWSCNPTKLRL